MNLEQAKEYAKKGRKIRLDDWFVTEFVYYISHSDLCSAFKYGYGDYWGEPSFKGVFAKVTKGNHIVVGWEPTEEEKKSRSWIVSGTWKQEEKVYG